MASDTEHPKSRQLWTFISDTMGTFIAQDQPLWNDAVAAEIMRQAPELVKAWAMANLEMLLSMEVEEAKSHMAEPAHRLTRR